MKLLNLNYFSRSLFGFCLAWLLTLVPASAQITYAENPITGLTASVNSTTGILQVSFSLAKKEQIASIFIMLEGPMPAAAGVPNGITCYPYYYVNEMFWAYQNKKIPYQQNPLSLDISLTEAQKAVTGIRIYTTNQQGKPSEPMSLSLDRK